MTLDKAELAVAREARLDRIGRLCQFGRHDDPELLRLWAGGRPREEVEPIRHGAKIPNSPAMARHAFHTNAYVRREVEACRTRRGTTLEGLRRRWGGRLSGDFCG